LSVVKKGKRMQRVYILYKLIPSWRIVRQSKWRLLKIRERRILLWRKHKYIAQNKK
jgi:hypothetical protein